MTSHSSTPPAAARLDDFGRSVPTTTATTTPAAVCQHPPAARSRNNNADHRQEQQQRPPPPPPRTQRRNDHRRPFDQSAAGPQRTRHSDYKRARYFADEHGDECDPRRQQQQQEERELPEVGSVIFGHVCRMEPYGAFVEWRDEKCRGGGRGGGGGGGCYMRGLIHISELSASRVSSVTDVVQLNQPIHARILLVEHINNNNNNNNNNNSHHHHQPPKIKLSLRGIQPETGEILEEYHAHHHRPPHPSSSSSAAGPFRRETVVSSQLKRRAQERAQLVEQLAQNHSASSPSWMPVLPDENDTTTTALPQLSPQQKQSLSHLSPQQQQSLLRLLYSASPVAEDNNKKKTKETTKEANHSDTSSDDDTSSSSSSDRHRKRRQKRSHTKKKKTHSRTKKTTNNKKRPSRYSSSSSSSSSSSDSSSSSSSSSFSEQETETRSYSPIHDIPAPPAPPAAAAIQVAEDSDDSSVGPRPAARHDPDGNLLTERQIQQQQLSKKSGGDYGKALLPGEGQAMAQFVQQNLRVPRRGEIGYQADEIERYEQSGFVMSGSRHSRMNAVRIRKENQVYTAEEQRALHLLTLQENQQRESALVQDWKQMLLHQKQNKQQQQQQQQQQQTKATTANTKDATTTT